MRRGIRSAWSCAGSTNRWRQLALRFRKTVIVLAIIIMAVTVYPFMKLGSEFMPPLYEGTLFYMPVTVPAASITEVSELLQLQDRLLKKIPEVAQVFGKAGRAETATDPAPLEMFETVINLKPESEWRPGMTVETLKNEMNDALSIPGVANSFTMPIKARIDMLSTGIRTPVGIKVLGPNLDELEKIGMEIEKLVKDVPGTRSAYAERVTTGYFLDFNMKREEIARYGLSVDDVQEMVQSAVGGMNLTTTVEGRERYPVNVRYARELRNDVEKLKRVLVPVMPAVGSAACRRPSAGAPGRSPRCRWGNWPTSGSSRARRRSRAKRGSSPPMSTSIFPGGTWAGTWTTPRRRSPRLKIPDGYRLEWSGEYEYLVKTHERLKVVMPLTALIIFVLIFLNTQSHHQDHDRSSGRAVFPGRLLLAALSARLQHEHRRLGGHHRPGRAGCGNGRRHAPLPRSCP